MRTYIWQRGTQLHIMHPVGIEIAQHGEDKFTPDRSECDQSMDDALVAS